LDDQWRQTPKLNAFDPSKPKAATCIRSGDKSKRDPSTMFTWDGRPMADPDRAADDDGAAAPVEYALIAARARPVVIGR
jgi:hypothetical protein